MAQNNQVVRYGRFDYGTKQRVFWALESRKDQGVLATDPGFGSTRWDVPRLYSSEEEARSICGGAAKVVQVRLEVVQTVGLGKKRRVHGR